VESKWIDHVANRLLDAFGGYTYFPQPNKGAWRVGHVTFHDEIVIFRVLTGKHRQPKRFFKGLKTELKRIVQQEEMLVTGIEVELY
jgi:hypothetical protein